MSDMVVSSDGVSRGESVRDRRHRPMSHDDSYGPQLYIPACPCWPVTVVVKWRGQVDNSFNGSHQKQL